MSSAVAADFSSDKFEMVRALRYVACFYRFTCRERGREKSAMSLSSRNKTKVQSAHVSKRNARGHTKEFFRCRSLFFASFFPFGGLLASFAVKRVKRSLLRFFCGSCFFCRCRFVEALILSRHARRGD